MKRYIIAHKTKRWFIARRYVGEFRCYDYPCEFYREYGNRFKAFAALIYDTIEDAERYIMLHNLEDEWHIREYNVGCGCLVGGFDK